MIRPARNRFEIPPPPIVPRASLIFERPIPPGKRTGISRQGCYMAFTGNCCERMSGEHIISSTILGKLGSIEVANMRWQKPGMSQELPPRALRANVLCSRHNSALSVLDTIAGHFFDALAEQVRHLGRDKVAHSKVHFSISAGAIELWGFKTAAAMHFGRTWLVNGPANLSFPAARLQEALEARSTPNPFGLYAAALVGPQDERFGWSTGPLYAIGGEFVGFVLRIAAFELTFVLNDLDSPPPWRPQLLQRPRALVVRASGVSLRESTIELLWPPGVSQSGNVVSIGNPWPVWRAR